MIPPTPPPPDPRLPTPIEAVGILAAGMLALFLVGPLVATVALSTAGPPEDWPRLVADRATNPLLNEPRWVILGTALPELGVGLVLYAAIRYLGYDLRRLLPAQLPTWRGLGGSLLVVFGLVPLAELVHATILRTGWTRGTFGEEGTTEIILRTLAGGGPSALWFAILGIAVVPALVEETLFRGVVTSAYRGSEVTALLAPSVLFGLFHLEPAQAAATTVLGLGFGIARLGTGTLVAPILAHAIYNSVVIASAFSEDTSSAPPGVQSLLVGLAAVVGGGMLLYPTRRPAPTPAPPDASPPPPESSPDHTPEA